MAGIHPVGSRVAWRAIQEGGECWPHTMAGVVLGMLIGAGFLATECEYLAEPIERRRKARRFRRERRRRQKDIRRES